MEEEILELHGTLHVGIYTESVLAGTSNPKLTERRKSIVPMGML